MKHEDPLLSENLIRVGLASAPRFTCLIVDSAKRSQRTLAASLCGLELRVLAVSTAQQALRLLRETPVDLVIAEERLPGTTGSALLEAMAHFFPEVGRILIGRELGSDALTKAVNRARVHRVLHRAMPLHALRAEVDGALNEVLLTRSRTSSHRLTQNEAPTHLSA